MRTPIVILAVLVQLLPGLASAQRQDLEPLLDHVPVIQSARGVLRAEQEAVLASTISERILDVVFTEGDAFEKGAVLIRFDCSRMEAQLSAAQAAAAAASRNAQVQSELLSMGATGRADLDIAQYKASQLTSEVEVIRQQMAGCEVTAPFSGHVVEPLVRDSEAPAPNEPLVHIVSDGPLELHMIVPSCWLGWLKWGREFDFHVDETGDQLTAEVLRIAAAVDPVSQTVKVIGRIDEVPEHVLPGMSGTARWSGDLEVIDGVVNCVVGQER